MDNNNEQYATIHWLTKIWISKPSTALKNEKSVILGLKFEVIGPYLTSRFFDIW